MKSASHWRGKKRQAFLVARNFFFGRAFFFGQDAVGRRGGESARKMARFTRFVKQLLSNQQQRCDEQSLH